MCTLVFSDGILLLDYYSLMILYKIILVFKLKNPDCPMLFIQHVETNVLLHNPLYGFRLCPNCHVVAS